MSESPCSQSDFSTYLNPFIKNFRAQLLEDTVGGDAPLFKSYANAAPVVDSACEWLDKRVRWASQRCLIAAFHMWREGTDYVATPDSSEALEKFCSLLRAPRQREALVDAQFPLLAKRLEHIVRSALRSILECLHRYEQDRTRIPEYLNLEVDSSVVGIELHDEETHNEGRSVTFLTLAGTNSSEYADTRKLVYKPRSGQGELAIDRVCQMLGAGRFEHVPPTWDRGDYCWQEFVDECDSDQFDPQHFFKSAGRLVAATHILGTTDLHNDNVRCSASSTPMIIDGETAVQLRAPEGVEVDATDILSSGLIPSAQQGLTGWRNFAGLGLATDEKPTHIVFETVNAGTDAIAFERSEELLPESTVLPRKIVTAEEKAQAFELLIAEVESIRDRVLHTEGREAVELHQLLEEIQTTLRWRQVIRATSGYQAILDATLMPEPTTGKDDPAEMLRQGPSRFNSPRLIGGVEVQQIADLDIPYFQADIEGRLWARKSSANFADNADGTMTPDDPWVHIADQSFSKRLSRPTERLADFLSADGERQIDVLRTNAEMIVGQVWSDHQALASSWFASSTPSTTNAWGAPKERTCRPEQKLFAYLQSQETGMLETRRWLCHTIADNGVRYMLESPSMFYSDGTAWALGLERRCGQPLEHTLLEMLTKHQANPHVWAAFGQGTTLLATGLIENLNHDEKRQVFDSLGASLEKELEDSNEDQLGDFFGGWLAPWVFLSKQSSSTRNIALCDLRLVRTLDEAESRLLHRMEAESDSAELGLAHGLAGTLLAVSNMRRLTGSAADSAATVRVQTEHELARRIASQAALILSDGGVDKPLALCNGASGMMLSLLHSGFGDIGEELWFEYRNSMEDRIAQLGTDETNAHDISLCHGLAGELFTLRHAERHLGDEANRVAARELLEDLARLTENVVFAGRGYCGYSNNRRDMGFLNGYGGLFHALYPGYTPERSHHTETSPVPAFVGGRTS